MGRHPKDILRSYAHELIHHHQNLSGTLNHSNTTNTNEDGNLEKIEREAYEEGNILFRNWEDSIKNEESRIRRHSLKNLLKLRALNPYLVKVVGEDCGCEERKNKLNQKFPYKNED